jgi:HK97 gp10 family phage protein
MNITLKMVGVDDIQRDLGLLVNRGKISRTLEKAAILVKSEAQRYCPYETGKLQSSIDEHKVSDLTWEIAATAEYADYVEFGTYKMRAGTPQAPYIYKGPSRVGKYPSYRPFLRSALWDCQQRIIDMFNEAINEK